MRQPHRDALSFRPVALDVEFVRPHIGGGALAVGLRQLRRRQRQPRALPDAARGHAGQRVDVAQEAVDEGRGGRLPDFARRAHLLDAARVHQHHPVGHFQRLFLVVRHEHAGHVQLVVQPAQPAAQFLAHLGVQRAKGFVQQQHARLHRQRARQGDALALAARQLGRIAIGQPVQLHQPEQVVHLALDLVLGRTLRTMLDAQAEGHVLEHGHVLEQRVVLEHEPDLALAHVHGGGVLAGEQHAARVGRFQARDDAQQRGLAAAGRSQQRDQLAGLDMQRYVVERAELAEALGQIADFYAHVCLRRAPCQAAACVMATAGPGYSVGWLAACSCFALRHSTRFLATSVTSASRASKEATAKAAEY